MPQNDKDKMDLNEAAGSDCANQQELSSEGEAELEAKLDASQLLPMEWLNKAADCMRVLAHPARMRIVDILSRGKFPVGEIARLCELPPNQACEHLRLMKSHGMLDADRKGRVVYYRIVMPQVVSLLGCVRKNCPAELLPDEMKPEAGDTK